MSAEIPSTPPAPEMADSPPSVINGEHITVPPIVIHFRGYCEKVGIDINSMDPQYSHALAQSIHNYLGYAIDDLSARRQADSNGTAPALRRIPTQRIERHMREFYGFHGATPPSDKIQRDRRVDYLKHGTSAALSHKDRYPEIALTEHLAACLRNAGHELAADSALILLAVTGESFRGLRI